MIQARGGTGTKRQWSVASDQWPEVFFLTIDHWPLLLHSAIFATWTSNPVFGSRDVSANALNPSPLISV